MDICVWICCTDEEFVFADSIGQTMLEELASSTVSGYFASTCYKKVHICKHVHISLFLCIFVCVFVYVFIYVYVYVYI